MVFNFTATHGVAVMAGDKVVAAFQRVPGGNTSDGGPVYSFGTADTKIAAVVRATEGFGIVEAKPAAPTKR